MIFMTELAEHNAAKDRDSDPESERARLWLRRRSFRIAIPPAYVRRQVVTFVGWGDT
jgi:hypothetical protein